MQSQTPKQIAIEKGKSEIEKGISTAINITRLMGLGEIIYYLHVMRISRLAEYHKNYDKSKEQVLKPVMHHVNDAYRYIFQLLVKYASKKFVLENKVGFYNREMVVELTRFIMELNQKYEANTFLTMTPKVEVYGERNQHVKFNLQDILNDSKLAKYMYYGARVELDNEFEINSLLQKDDYFKKFKKEYEPFEDLFIEEFGVTINTFLELIDLMLSNYETIIKNNLNKYIYIDKEKIDVHAEETMIQMSPALFQDKQEFIEKFGDNIINVLNKLTFDTTKFNEKELRYNLINRQPLISYGDQYIISPDLLLDCLFVNTHYLFLENVYTKDHYKKRFSESFLDQIAEVSSKYNFTEFGRNLELYNNKQQLGDIDLLLKSDKEEYLYIEAKDHSIPMDVRIHIQEDVEKRLNYLKVNWESKVLKRIEHLKVNYAKYDLPAKFTYIIVSRSPEIISHFSQINVFTLREYECYLKEGNLSATFDSIESKLYNNYDGDLSREELKEIQDAFGGHVRFEKD